MKLRRFPTCRESRCGNGSDARRKRPSNFPVDKVSCSYTNLWNAYKRVATALELSATERNELFHGCAARVYQIELRQQGAM